MTHKTLLEEEWRRKEWRNYQLFQFGSASPFAGLLLSIAVMPLIKPDWWEKHQPLAVAFWSVLFIVPFAAKYGMFTMGETVLECVVNDYLTFIILLFGLFCCSR